MGSDEYRTFCLVINRGSFAVCYRCLAMKLANHLQLVLNIDWSCTSTPSYAFMTCTRTALPLPSTDWNVGMVAALIRLYVSRNKGRRVPGVWGSQVSRQSVHEGGKVVSPTHRPPLPPRKYSWYSFLLEAESNSGPQCGRKDYVNGKIQWQLGIEPATFRLVAQWCLK